MKQAPWIGAAIALAVVVFVVTFAMNYTGGSRPATSQGVQATQVRTLTFWMGSQAPMLSNEEKQLVAKGVATAPVVDWEERKPGHWDFWFRNENADALPIGVKTFGCKRCTRFHVYVLPDGARRPALLMAGLGGLGGGGPLAAAGYLAAGTEALAADVQPQQLLADQGSVDVPAGALGWMRLGWRDVEVGTPPLVFAQLWMDQDIADSTPTIVGTRVRHVRPLRAQPLEPVGAVEDTELPQTVQFACWSSTRPDFKVKAKLVPVHGGASADALAVAKPKPLSREQLLNLERFNNHSEAPPQNAGAVLAGYMVRITLNRFAPDGKTPVDLGPFQRFVDLTIEGLEMEPVRVELRGRVRGVVDVIVDDETQGLNLGAFRRSEGSDVKNVPLQSNVAGLDVEVDRRLTPKFLKAVLVGPEDPKAARRAWTLQISVRPNSTSGDFPRSDDPAYEDSAVHLIATKKGEAPRRIRIPVRGRTLDD